jgi:AraC-like DNA-binding protein
VQYFEISPSPLLSPYIKSYWFLEGTFPAGTVQPERIFPDGCMELIIHYGDVFQRVAHNKTEKQSNGFVFGQIEEFIELLPGQSTGVMGIKFYPQGLSHFTQMPMYEIKHQSIDIPDLFKNGSRQLAEKVALASNANGKANIVNDFLLGQLQPLKRNSNLINVMVEDIYSTQGRIGVRDLIQKYHTTERQLERLFATHVGLSAKTFGRIIRFQRAFQLAPQAKSLTHLAFDAGYFDQAHFSREFKSFTGLSPRQYFNNNNAFSSLFLDD